MALEARGRIALDRRLLQNCCFPPYRNATVPSVPPAPSSAVLAFAWSLGNARSLVTGAKDGSSGQPVRSRAAVNNLDPHWRDPCGGGGQGVWVGGGG